MLNASTSQDSKTAELLDLNRQILAAEMAAIRAGAESLLHTAHLESLARRALLIERSSQNAG